MGRGMEIPCCIFCVHFGRIGDNPGVVTNPGTCKCYKHDIILPAEKYAYLICRDWEYKYDNPTVKEREKSYIEKLQFGLLYGKQTQYERYKPIGNIRE